jgi:hypothetical protein
MKVAQLCDEALSASGVLIQLAAYEMSGTDDVRRRALLNGVALLSSVGVADMSLLARAVRASLMDKFDVHTSIEDWLELAEEHGRRCMSDPPAVMRRALVGDMLLLNQRVADESDDRELWVVTARLAALYAMTVASMGDTREAVRWYRTAKVAADASGDRHLIAWVRGREVLRSDYDGYGTPDQILTYVRDQSGLVDQSPVGRMEIMVAASRAYARIGEHTRARDAFEDARRAFDATPSAPTGTESMYYLPEWRFLLRGVFVDALAGDRVRVDRVLSEIATGGPMRWGVQADLNRALAAAADGDAGAAVDLAVATIQRVPYPQHTQTMRQLVEAICGTLSGEVHRESVRYLHELVA